MIYVHFNALIQTESDNIKQTRTIPRPIYQWLRSEDGSWLYLNINVTILASFSTQLLREEKKKTERAFTFCMMPFS